MRKELWAEATASFRHAAELDPDNAFLQNQLAVAYVENGDSAEAIAVLERAVVLDPDLALSHMILGQARNSSGDEAGAAASFERWRELDPQDPGALNAIAWLYATAKDPTVRNPEMALFFAERAVQFSEERDPSILDTLAESHYVNGNFDEAIEIEKKVLTMAPDNDVFREQLSKFERAKSGAQ